MSRAAEVIAAATAGGLTIGVAESLTGGLVSATLVAIPGASLVVRGAVVAYATDIKASMLGVDAELLASVGPVDAQVAEQMARGAAATLGADIGVATTGVAGPGAHDGHPAGTVIIAVATPAGSRSIELSLSGGRDAVRAAATAAAIELLADAVVSFASQQGTRSAFDALDGT